MSDSNIQKAFKFYIEHIYKVELFKMLEQHNLKVPGCTPSVLWELFGAILTGAKGTGNTGADLNGWEVKSSTMKSSFEYQYHLNTGLEKLNEDCVVNHLFCSYTQDYSRVEVRAMCGPDLAPKFFNNWREGYTENYDSNAASGKRRQRYRKAISFGHVAKNGTLILVIEDGKIVFQDGQSLDTFCSMLT